MIQKHWTHKKFQIASLTLVLIAATVVTVSDYWTSLKSVMVQSENYAHRVASHLSQLVVTHGSDEMGKMVLTSPESFRDHEKRVENVIPASVWKISRYSTLTVSFFFPWTVLSSGRWPGTTVPSTLPCKG